MNSRENTTTEADAVQQVQEILEEHPEFLEALPPAERAVAEALLD